MSDHSRVAVSVVVPVHEMADPLDELYAEYAAALRASGQPVEFLFVTEPRFAAHGARLAAVARRTGTVRVLEAGQPLGEAALIKAALPLCRGPVVLTLPAYRRVEASGLPALIGCVDDGADVAVARRWPRRDGRLNQLQNRGLHALIRWLLRVDLNDVACGVRAARRKVLEEIPLYGDNARFLGVIGARLGYRVDEVAIPQHARDVRPRLYPPGTYLRRLLDILALFFVLRFTQKPLRFFGLFGSLLAAVGVGVLAILTWQRLGGQALAGRPLLLGGVLLLILGVQLVALGLIGEIIVFLGTPRGSTYRLRSDGRPAR